MSHTERELLSVLDTLYEGLLDEEAWQRALIATTDLVSGSAIALFSLNPSTGEVYRSDVFRMDPRVMNTYHQDWINQDPRHAAGLTCPVGEPQADGMLVGIREFHRTPIYNELLLPEDCPFHLATWIERRPNRGVVLSVQGTLAHGCFTAEERERMRLLIPHFRRVVELKDRLARAHTTAGALLDTMDRLPFGVMLLTDSLEILEASASSRQLLSRREGIHADQGRLGFVRHADEVAFARKLQEDRVKADCSDAIVIQRLGLPSLSRSPLSLLVLPLRLDQQHWLHPGARWMVLLFDPESAPALPEQVLQKSLGISAAEATLARLLAHGWSLSRAADHLGISRHTVRAQLKSIYAQTGLNSQAQLVRRIMTSPALVGPTLST